MVPIRSNARMRPPGQGFGRRGRRLTIVVLAAPVMGAFVVEALHARADVVAASDAPDALEAISTSGPSAVDAVVVSYSVVRRRPRPLGCMPFVRRMFDEWPWVPIVVLCRAQHAERLRAEALPGSGSAPTSPATWPTRPASVSSPRWPA